MSILSPSSAQSIRISGRRIPKNGLPKIQKTSFGEMECEIYPDGDLLLTTPDHLYYQIPSDDVLRIARALMGNSPPMAQPAQPDQGEKSRQDARKKAEPVLCGCIIAPEFPKSIRQTDSGLWEVNVWHNGEKRRRAYQTRQHARQAKWSDAIGENGRVA